MGLLRVLLALVVLLEHTGGFGGYQMIGGPLAVQGFFIISGFYMGLVLNERYNRPALNFTFYANRAIRIYPVYFLALTAYLVIFLSAQLSSGASPLWPYLGDDISGLEKAFLSLLNLTIVGQDLPLFLQIDGGHLAFTGERGGAGELEPFRFMVIPVAWTLSLELCFYAMAPFIARRPVWQIAALFALSLAARIAAALAGLTADPFSYRFFPFELALFLAGVLAYRGFAAFSTFWARSWTKLLALSVPLAIVSYPVLRGGWSPDEFFTVPRLGLLVLIALALPAIHGWTRHSERDRQVGELSYPLYLCHLLVFGLLGGIGPMRDSSAVRSIVVGVVSLVLAWLIAQLIDRRIEAFRRRLATRAGVAA